MSDSPDKAGATGNELSDELLEHIVDKYGTPCYVFSEAQLLDNFQRLTEAMRRHVDELRVLYSVKNNPLAAVIDLFASAGSWFECSAPAEIVALSRLGIDMDHCLETAVARTVDDVAENRRLLARRFTVDSVHDVEVLANGRGRRRLDVLLRVNTSVEAKGTRFHSAGPMSKAGASIPGSGAAVGDDVFSVAEAVARTPGLRLTGLHGHIGSQVLERFEFQSHVDTLTHLATQIEESTGCPLRQLDVGGGFPVDYGSSTIPSLTTVADWIGTAVAASSYRGEVYIEPGRVLTANAGVLVASVLKTRRTLGQETTAILDACVYNTLLDVLVAGWSYPIRLLGGDINEVERSRLVGNMNDTLDVFGQVGTDLPGDGRALEPGDLVTFNMAGAYTLSFNMNYGLYPMPRVLMVGVDGTERLIRDQLAEHVYAELGTVPARPWRPRDADNRVI
jgi:diaminopimelate decarboxylase